MRRILLFGLVSCLSCGGAKQDAAVTVRRDALEGGPFPAVLMVQAQFDMVTGEDGRSKPVPGPAKLSIVRKRPDRWETVVVEDDESNVFHKALPFPLADGGTGILTIGAEDARLKLWRWDGQRWSAEVLWGPTFGGKWDRLRDVEVGDVTGDGNPEIVVATHDQGVVAVLTRTDEGWAVTELGRQPETFVHEVEIGDVDGDGLQEFFVTPSEPNKLGVLQPGMVMMYRWDGSQFQGSVVDSFPTRHAKEILVVDPDGDGIATLFVALEAVLEGPEGNETIKEPVEIRRYDFAEGVVKHDVVATLPDAQCRFLVPGDFRGDGAVELVAAAMKSGLWLISPRDGTTWTREQIDPNSSGYEHACVACDLDADGADELFVASDDQGELRCYRWSEEGFQKEVIRPLADNVITWNLSCARF
jgi:hypothetical protein